MLFKRIGVGKIRKANGDVHYAYFVPDDSTDTKILRLVVESSGPITDLTIEIGEK